MPEDHSCLYEFNHKPIELRGVTAGTVKHKQSDGFEVLIQKVLKKINHLSNAICKDNKNEQQNKS